MKSGPELDATIAREILKLEQNSSSPHLWRDPKFHSSPYVRLHEYSTDIASAWEVVESFANTPWRFHLDDISDINGRRWRAAFANSNAGQSKYAEAETAAEAICLASLQVK